MVRVPRYGTHNGVKYSPRRTLIRFCELCGIPFNNIGHGKKFCGDECYQEHNRTQQREERNPLLNFINNDDNNAKWNPINNPKNSSKRDKYAWAIYWKNWYRNQHPTYKKQYNANKKRKKGEL